MDVSVIVPTYNRAASLRDTFEALEGQQLPSALAWEVVVVDNNSRDETASVVREFAARGSIPMKYVFEPRQGVSWARNTGIASASGDIIAFTDDDILPGADWVASFAPLLREHSADILGGRVLPRWSRPAPDWISGSRSLLNTLALMDHGAVERITAATRHPRVWTCNLAMKRDVIARIGPFDTGLGPKGENLYRGEDSDLLSRALAHSLVVLYDPRLVVWHKVPEERMRLSYFRRWNFQSAEGMALGAGRPTGRRLLGVSLFSYRWLIVRLAAWLLALSRRRQDSLELEMDFIAAAGRWWGEWRRSRAGGEQPAAGRARQGAE